jgi:hypothetical protein
VSVFEALAAFAAASGVIAVTEHSIVIATPSGVSLKFRRVGREHLA